MPDSPSSDSTPPRTTGVRSDPQAELQERLRQATIGEYDILGQLGFGGMASVYLAQDLSLDRRVAIKVMSPAMVYGEGLVERFRLEARTAAALSHPNIIPIYAVREADGLLYFVMKAVEGTSLHAVIDEVGPLPIPMVEAIMAQVGGALGYAHRHGVVHRDVKPANILLDEEGWVVVTDFGIAKVADASALTMTGAAVGTPTYMSPEQCAGGEITGASDQYSLGIVVYEMITGRPPFVDLSIPALMVGHTTRTPPPILDVRPDCPVALRMAVERLLAKDPVDRFPSVEEAISAADARPLSPDDSTRGTLVTLAKNSATRHLIARVRTPRNPVPLIHRSGPSPTNDASPPRRTSLLIMGSLAVGVTLTALTVWALRPKAAPIGAPLVAPDTALVRDSLTSGQGGQFETTPATESRPAPTRQPPPRETPVAAAPAAVVTAPPPPPPPPPVADIPLTPRLADRPRQAADSALPRAAVPPPPTAVPTPAADPRVEVEAVLQAYASALEAGRMDQAVRLFPTMPADQRQGLEEFYRDGGTMETQWRLVDVVIAGATATLRVVGTSQTKTARTGSSEQRVSLRARLERGPGGWRLVALVN